MLAECTKAVKWFYFISVVLHIKFCQKWLSSMTYYKIYNINYITVHRLHFKHYMFIYILQYVCILLPAAYWCCLVRVKWNSLPPTPNQPAASVSYVLLFSWPHIISRLSRAVYIHRKEARIPTCNQHATIIIQTYYPKFCLKLIDFLPSFWIIITGFQLLLLMTRCKPFHHFQHCYL